MVLTQPESDKSGDQTLREICRTAHRHGLRVFLWHNASGFYTGLRVADPVCHPRSGR